MIGSFIRDHISHNNLRILVYLFPSRAPSSRASGEMYDNDSDMSDKPGQYIREGLCSHAATTNTHLSF